MPHSLLNCVICELRNAWYAGFVKKKRHDRFFMTENLITCCQWNISKEKQRFDRVSWTFRIFSSFHPSLSKWPPSPIDPCEILTDFLYSFFRMEFQNIFSSFFGCWFIMCSFAIIRWNSFPFFTFLRAVVGAGSTHPAAAARDKQHFCVVVMLLVQIIDEKFEKKGTQRFPWLSDRDRGTEKHSFLDCFDTYPPFLAWCFQFHFENSSWNSSACLRSLGIALWLPKWAPRRSIRH